MIRRVRLILCARGVLAVAAVAVGAVLTIMAVDAAVVLYHPLARWAFSLAGLGLTLATAWSMLAVPLSRPLTLTRMARVLETRHPDMQERISSAIELAEHGGMDGERASAELVGLLTQDAAADLAGVAPRREFTVRTVKPFLLASAAAFLVLGALFALWPRQSWLLFLRALAPNVEFDTLEASVLEVKPGDIMQLAHRELRFEVKAPERHGLRAEIHFSWRDGHRTVERMKRLSAQGAEAVVFELEIPSVGQSFEYRVRYGNGYTRPYTVSVMTEPAVVGTRVDYAFPAYTGLQPTQTVGVAQDIVALAGTRIRIEGAFDRTCSAALRLNELALENSAGVASNGVWEQTMSTNRTGRWALALRDGYGFTNRLQWAAYAVVPDRPPEVTLRLPEASRLTLPPYDRLVCEGEASDDFGFGAMELVLRSDKLGERAIPLKVAKQGATRATLEGSPDLKALFDQNYRSFKMCLRVADNLPPELGGPQIRESREVAVSLDMGARTLREQVREATRKELEQQLRKAAQELNEAAQRVAEERWTYDRPELTEKAAAKLEQARQAAVRAEERMRQAVQATAKTPFAPFAKDILDVRDEKVEPAFQKLEKIPVTASDTRKQLGEETERAFREAAEKVNELVWKNLQEENRKQEEQSRLGELAQREQAMAQEAEASKMNKQEMQQWANRQNEAEQKLWQSKQQMDDAAFNKTLENVRQAREAMFAADRAATPEAGQTLRREEHAAREAEKAAELAEKAAEQAVQATEQAREVADVRAASDAVRKAAEKTSAAAEKAAQAASKAGQAADKRAANEAAADTARRQEAAQQAQKAAEEAGQAAKTADQGAEQAARAAEAQQSGQKEQAKAAGEEAKQQATAADRQAQGANAKAVEAARQAEEQNLAKAAEAGRLASESAAATRRAAELAREAEAARAKADGQPTDAGQKEAALKEARGLSEQARQVAAEAKSKADEAAQRAKEQLDQLAQEAREAAARQAKPEEIAAQAQEAVKGAREAAAQAREAVAAAREAAAETKNAPLVERALAERLTEASSLAEQAGKLAERSGARTAQAETEKKVDAQGRAETRQATQEAKEAAELAAEAAALARQTAQRAATEMADRKQASQQAAQRAVEQASEAMQKAEQAAKAASNAKAPDAQQAAEQSKASAQLTGEAATLARQALLSSEKAVPESDALAHGQAQQGADKAREALELARQARARAAKRDAAEAQQLEAAQRARQVAEAAAAVLENQAKREADAWTLVQGRMGGSMRRMANGGGGEGLGDAPRVSADPDWIRFRGGMTSEAYEEMLKKTPAEYRGLVKEYFEEVTREGQKQDERK